MERRTDLATTATRAKITAVRLVASLGLGYLGQALSSAELITCLLGETVRPGVDRFILSPSHYVTSVYAVAAELGLIERAILEGYGLDGSDLETIGSERTPLVDFTCGSLAQGLSVGIGYALADRLAGSGARTVVFTSDGEMEEGQTWEAALFAAHHALADLTVVVDCNDSQVDGRVSSVTTLEPVAAKWSAFGWDVSEVNGHAVGEVLEALEAPTGRRPRVVVAYTTATAGLTALGTVDDAHFLKLDGDLTSALVTELEAAL